MPTGQLTRYRPRGSQLSRYQPNPAYPLTRGAAIGSRLATAYEVAHAARQYSNFMNRHVFSKMGGGSRTVPLQQTAASVRGKRKTGGRNVGARPGRARGKRAKAMQPDRHEKLALPKAKPVNKGKGYNTSRSGTIVTHPKDKIPKWKLKRLGKYKSEVWQTVLLSRSNRLPASNNTLQTSRYPIKFPECLDSEKTMSVIFTPFCSNFSGVHTTMFRKVDDAGTDLTHDTTLRLDVIQNKADVKRHETNISSIGAVDTEPTIHYRGSAAASLVAGATNQDSILRYCDQLVKQVHLDLVFMASRAFPVQVSVSVVRAITPQSPYTLTTDNKRELCNGVGNHGMDWSTWRTEYFHEFTLPALRIGKKIPTYSVKKILKTNFLQTNTFNENTTAQDMSQAATTALGSNIHSHIDEVADGNQSGNFYVLIKYRKKQQPQQFTYKQVIESHADNVANASIELPVVSEASFDVPTLDGNATTAQIPNATGNAAISNNTGAPFNTNQGDESKASFYLNGKLKYCWGFQETVDNIPSVMSFTEGSSDYRKPVSLMVDPTYDTTNQTYGLYQRSPEHVNIAVSTANTGP